jgi:outer membrane protein assembly factor BamB
VIGTGNLVYFTEGEKLFALNISDGQALWSFTADGNLRSPALADNGRLYVISDAGTLYCFTESGAKLWSVKHTNQWTGQGLTIGTDGTFYFGASDGWLYAINSDSSLKWKYQVGSWINGVPALDSQGNIYFGSTTHSVYALRPNGTLIWSFTTDDFVDASPSIDEGRNTVYVGSVGGTLFALNRLTGVKRWEFKTGGALYRAAAIGSDGRVYLGSINGIFYAISNNGTQIWSVALDGPVHGLPSIDTDGTIYVGTEGGSVYAINSDGSIRWQHTIGGLVNFGTVIANSIIYASSTSGFVAIENAASPTPGATVTLTPTVTVTTTPGITPTPITPTPIKTPSTTSSPTVVNLDQCTVSIENGKAFTKRRDITIKSNMSTATEMQVSNDGGFAGATWQPFRVNLSWTLGDPGVRIASLFVYVRFRNANGLLCNGNNLIDDVVYDPLPPKVLGVVVRNDQSDHSLFATVSQEAEGVRLRIIATDQLGGSEVDVMQISSRADFADSVWEPYMTEKSIAMQANAKLYVRVRDGAENVSESVVVSSSDMRFVFLPVVTK